MLSATRMLAIAIIAFDIAGFVLIAPVIPFKVSYAASCNPTVLTVPKGSGIQVCSSGGSIHGYESVSQRFLRFGGYLANGTGGYHIGRGIPNPFTYIINLVPIN